MAFDNVILPRRASFDRIAEIAKDNDWGKFSNQGDRLIVHVGLIGFLCVEYFVAEYDLRISKLTGKQYFCKTAQRLYLDTPEKAEQDYMNTCNVFM